jgi:hypothetical protein
LNLCRRKAAVEWFVAGKEIAVKKYVVRLRPEKHAEFDELIRKGKRSAQLMTLRTDRLNCRGFCRKEDK